MYIILFKICILLYDYITVFWQTIALYSTICRTFLHKIVIVGN